MTDDDKRSAKIYLEACALGYAASVDQLPKIVAAADELDRWAGAKSALHDAGVQLAAALGNLDAAEHAELEALRRFRDGVVALREELARDVPESCAIAIETIDALLFFAAPGHNPAKEPAQ